MGQNVRLAVFLFAITRWKIDIKSKAGEVVAPHFPLNNNFQANEEDKNLKTMSLLNVKIAG